MNNILNAEEIRIIGSLIEKELTTPEYYPLTINSLKNACNQKSNRNPVVSYDENLIEVVLNKLRDKSLARRVTGTDIRVPKYKQGFTEELNLQPDETAVICELMLRGPQTPGELKGRASRMFNFASLSQVDEVIQRLMNREQPMVIKLPRQTGMKESRYAHLLSGEPEINAPEAEAAVAVNTEADRIVKLEEELLTLRNDFEELKQQFENLRAQLE
ncbi:MAG: YceH family protein [Ignavibacteriaceae bacterium]|nr:YceH family protein [Ignavibacteriaceae bacterium]